MVDGIIKLEDYAEQFFNKQLLFKRYSPSEQHGCATQINGRLTAINVKILWRLARQPILTS